MTETESLSPEMPVTRRSNKRRKLVTIQPTMLDDALPEDKTGPDVLIPRNPDCDTFTRPVDLTNKTVDYGRRPTIVDTNFNNFFAGDEEVLSLFSSAPDLSRMIKSVVIVDVGLSTASGEVKQFSGTGCLVSPTIVFTVAHLFDREDDAKFQWIRIYLTEKDYFESNNGFDGEQETIPCKILELMLDHVNVTSEERCADRSTLDFAVLRLQNPVDRLQESLLMMPIEYPGSNELYGCDQTICFMGKPGVLEGDITEAFSTRFRDYVRFTYVQPRNILEEFVRESIFKSECVVASFGTTLCSYGRRDIGQYYYLCLTSTFNGMSGGPVVNMAAPDTLLGIVVGGYIKVPKSLFLRADCAIVQACYRHFVLGKDA